MSREGGEALGQGRGGEGRGGEEEGRLPAFSGEASGIGSVRV